MTTAEALLSHAFPTADAAQQEVEAVVREHARLVYRIAYSVLRNHHDAEDAVQETFLRVLRHRHKLAGVTERKAWLGRIAWRIALDRIRKRGSAHAQAEWDDAAAAVAALRSAGASAEQIASDRQMISLLERLIAALPADLRAVLTLSTVEELTSSEISALLEIPEASVRQRVFRARQILREKLAALLEVKHGR